jgi:TatD DNase family protein
MKFIDIHGHIQFPEFDTDREETVKRAHNAGVGIISVGTGLESSRKAIELAEAHENTWAIVGIHPADTHGEVAQAEFDSIKELAKHPKVVAIGECGLDYFHSVPEDIARQRELFVQHIQLANELRKPLMLHVRNAKPNSKGGSATNDPANGSTIDPNEHNAYQEAIQILKQHAKVRADFHFFAGTVQDAKDIVEMGNLISFTGVLTFARNYDEVIKNTPLINIMSETDCPYVAPIPYRGKRCEPVHVIETIKKIAEIRGESLEVVSGQLLLNAKQFFGL